MTKCEKYLETMVLKRLQVFSWWNANQNRQFTSLSRKLKFYVTSAENTWIYEQKV